MDTAALLHSIYQCYRERRLADMLDHFDDSFRLLVALPDDPPDQPRRPRSKAEMALLTHKFLEEYDVLEFAPGVVHQSDHGATTDGTARFRHRRTGTIADLPFRQTWRFRDGKALEVDHQHDMAHIVGLFKPNDGA